MSLDKPLADNLAVRCDCNTFPLCMYGRLQEQAALREQLQGLTVRLSAAEQAQGAAERKAQQEQAQKQAAVQVSSNPWLCLLSCSTMPCLLCDTFSWL